MTASAYWCEKAWLPGGITDRVRVEVGDAPASTDRSSTNRTNTDEPVITAVHPGVDPRPGDHRLTGLVLPGFADTHSHAFHRALRGRTHSGTAGSATSGGSFWTWREQMYRVAAVLTPDAYLQLARAVFAEMVLAGVTVVGEFHYLRCHPAADGGSGAEAASGTQAAEMDAALVQAAREAGLRLTLLDACYLSGGLTADGHTPPEGAQRRFVDADVDAWASRVEGLREAPGLRRGVAVHSVRAVPEPALAVVAQTANSGPRGGAPLHVHLSEQPAENEACQAFYGRTPTALLADCGVLGPRTSAVHATHLTPADIALLGGSGTAVSLCPTTERDLADGIGPARALADAGCALHLGSDSHAVVDLLEEARAVEAHERLSSGRRGAFAPTELVHALTAAGHAALGWPEGGRIEVGALADLVAVRLDSPRTAGVDPAQLVMAATASDVTDVVVAGRAVVRSGAHATVDVGAALAQSISQVWRVADADRPGQEA